MHFSTGAFQTVFNIAPVDVFWKSILLSFKSMISRFLAESGVLLLLEEPDYLFTEPNEGVSHFPSNTQSLTIEQEKGVS